MKKTLILLFFISVTIVGYSQADINEVKSTKTKLTAKELPTVKKQAVSNANLYYGVQVGENKTGSLNKLDKDISAFEKTISETTDVQVLNELNEKLSTLKARREYLVNKPKSPKK